MQSDRVAIQDILDTTDRTRVKLSKIGAAILRHIQKYDDIHISPAPLGRLPTDDMKMEMKDKLTPQRGDL